MSKRLFAGALLLICASSNVPVSTFADDQISVPQQSVSLSSNANKSSNSTFYDVWKDASRDREVPVKIYWPETGKAPYPVVIFSHGLGGSDEAAAYLGEYWQQHGYVGVFIQHHGSDTEVWNKAKSKNKIGMIMTLKAAANAKNLIARIEDVQFTLDELARRNQNDAKFKDQLDLDKVAVAGHSFGAATALAIAGQNFGSAGKGIESTDKRIKSFIYLSPPVYKKQSFSKSYGVIQIPGMLVTGTEDKIAIGNTKPSERRIPYDNIKAPHQYLINFNGADHLVFNGRRGKRSLTPEEEKIQQMTAKATSEFLDATLENNKDAWEWLDSSGFSNFIGDAGKVEHK